MYRSAIRLLAFIAALSASGFADTVVYSNTTTDTLDTIPYGANGYTEAGDQITLAGTDRAATSALVQFFNLGAAGTFDATLRLFNVGAPVGSQIGGDFTLTGIAVPDTSVNSGVFDVNFSLPNLLVPDNLIFTVSFGNQSPGVTVLGLNLFEPPTVGSSDNTFAIAKDASGYLTPATSGENVFFELQAAAVTVPEPAMGSLAGAGVLVLAFLRRRRSA